MELDWKPTPISDTSLRRRRDPLSGDDVYEVKLGDEFLMSSLFTEGEIAPPDLASPHSRTARASMSPSAASASGTRHTPLWRSQGSAH